MALLFILVIGVIAVIIVKVGYLFTSTFLFISFLFLPVTSNDFVRVSILFLSFAYPETVGSQALVLLGTGQFILIYLLGAVVENVDLVCQPVQ